MLELCNGLHCLKDYQCSSKHCINYLCGTPDPDNPHEHDDEHPDNENVKHFKFAWWMIVLICVAGLLLIAALFILVRCCL